MQHVCAAYKNILQTVELQSYVVHTLVKMKGTTIPVANGAQE